MDFIFEYPQHKPHLAALKFSFLKSPHREIYRGGFSYNLTIFNKKHGAYRCLKMQLCLTSHPQMYTNGRDK